MFTDFDAELYSWVRGGLLLLAVYHILIYFQNQKKLYLFYGLYLLGIFIYYAKHLFPLELGESIYHYINFPIHFLSFASFFTFVRVLLDMKVKLPKWDTYFNIGVKALIWTALLFLLIQFTLGYQYQVMLIKFVAPFLSILVIVALFKILAIKIPMAKYLFIGAISYILLNNITLLQEFLGKDFFLNLGVEPLFFSYLGASIQAVIFTLIIASRIKVIEETNKNAEVKLAFKFKELEELKMTALQSQMNPHFLFNSLNSINNFVLKNDVEKASDYITKFSRLIRVILKSSSSLTIPFSDEIGILSLYVKLEQMRITGGFEYVVNVDEEINLEAVKVPPLFLQPFIENSIWHGLAQIKGEKKICLKITKEEGSIRCVIIDNGIGINKAKKETHKKINRRKFFGTKATENRIRLLYKNSNVDVNILDISNEKTTGTKVEIVFPYIIKL
ncbi:sensor histidine kinase [Urechidicola croceus]|uniref:Signal transduction histidine kinase internal region domain-containing protein n=1 Tax=Urechidicola croceus TaxID=1850246 RepID=A0A1D8P976_9FLAO|nr:histidine kinase [Urechidicola croceus]AOW21135.1 hypothetical protein LPB138_10800 [Urechidicola croceus]